MTRTYDADFRLATEAVTGGQSITFQYDNDSLLTAAGALSITRSPATGFVTGTTLGSVTDSRTYDSFGAEQTYSASFGASSLYSVDYGTRDALGRIVTKTETVLGAQQVYGYTYDARGRLTDVTKNAAPLSHYGYDANGNRIAGPGLTASPSYDAQDRLTSYGACAYGYKADGSLQMKTCSNGTTTYDFDAFGNLRNVALPNGTHIEYVIDGQNRRVGKKVCATAINVSCPASSLVEGFLYRNQLQPAAWLDGAGAVRRPMPGTDRGLLQATREKIPNARQTWILDRGERVLLFPVIAAALQPKAIFVGAAVWIGVSNGGAETLRACVTSVGEQRGRGGKFNADMHACRADDQFVALRPGDSYLFLQSRIGRRSSKYFLSVFVSQGTESASRVEVEVNTSSKLQVRGHPKARAVKAARVDNLIVIENGSDSPLAISTVTNGCKDSDSSKMLLLGHNRLTVSTQLSLDEIAVFDPAKPCKRIGAATIGRRQSD